MSEQLFKEIRSIEDKAVYILSDSETRSAEILKKANEQAFKSLAEREAAYKESGTKALDAALKDALRLKKKKLEKSKEELAEVRKMGNRRKDKAIDLILDRLTALIGE